MSERGESRISFTPRKVVPKTLTDYTQEISSNKIQSVSVSVIETEYYIQAGSRTEPETRTVGTVFPEICTDPVQNFPIDMSVTLCYLAACYGGPT